MIKDKTIYVTQSSMPPFEEYIEAIRPLWDSRWLTNMGTYHQELETQLREYLDVPFVSLMVNGHMALELAIQAMGFPAGSEVITTPFTFISTTHAIVRNRLKPIFCDIKASDGTIDETKIESLITENTVAILPVHVYGNVCNVEEIGQIAKRHDLKVIYDAAHAFGVKYWGRGIGSYGDVSIFSFHATKVFHSIEGGAVAFSDPGLYDRLYNLKNFGVRGEETVVSIGANAKMNEFCAIMGLCNLKYVERGVRERKRCYDLYRSLLEDVKGISFLDKKEHVCENYAYFPIIIEDDYRMCRDKLYDLLKEHKIYSRKYFYPITSDQKCFGDHFEKANLKKARELSKRILTLPLYEDLDNETIEKIVSVIK